MVWEVGKVYMTRGRFGTAARVRILCTDANHPQPIVGLLLAEAGLAREYDQPFNWNADGRWSRENEEPASLDLLPELAP